MVLATGQAVVPVWDRAAALASDQGVVQALGQGVVQALVREGQKGRSSHYESCFGVSSPIRCRIWHGHSLSCPPSP